MSDSNTDKPDALSPPQMISLRDYQPAPFEVASVHLCFELDLEETSVTSTLELSRRPGAAGPLELVGDALKCVSVKLNGELLSTEAYEVSPQLLTIPNPPERFSLEIKTSLSPINNKELMGLYASSGNFCTQCEAEGFRRITYYLDRPDVLSVFTTKLIADPERFPTLLSNGNLIEEGQLDTGRHFAVWHDPFPKPCYLFALVAGRFDVLEGHFTTMSGREVTLRVYTDIGQGDKCQHALNAIKKSMAWDELRYGREYDLDLFMVVAVHDFNFGAMENKGLNIFNSKYILASAETATDSDYAGVETVVAHEYFHNWSGNRVTLRDWFQLSLKEGLTVYRDQSFDEDNISKVVHRINVVNSLRNGQFKEDGGPMAHPVQPKSYLKIDNFYTATIYNKGSEVIRMFNLLLGDESYRAACDAYFDRFDGQAVTIQDWAQVMQEHTPLDLEPFLLWYDQAGTPELKITGRYDEAEGSYTLTATQSIPATPGQPDKRPMLIPIKLAILDQEGRELPTPELHNGELWLLKEAQEQITLRGDGQLKAPVVPSLLRHFSAPVKLDFEYTKAELELLCRHDQDGFNRWQALQLVSLAQLSPMIEAAQRGAKDEELCALVSERYLSSIGRIISEELDDRYYHAQLLTLPSEAYLADRQSEVDPVSIERSRSALRRAIAQRFEAELSARYDALTDESAEAQRYHVTHMGRRALRNTCLGYLMSLGEAHVERALAQFERALGVNMTDCIAAMSCLAHGDSVARVESLKRFEERWSGEGLVMNKWLSVQASAKRDDTLSVVTELLEHPAFHVETPNCVYSLVNVFTNQNAARFHALDGSGYRFLSAQVKRLDQINPMVAARIVTPLTHWRRYGEERGALMRAELESLTQGESLSENLRECVEKGLA